MTRKLLLGVEAIAQGAIDGGLSGVYAYPGTPSTEITEYIQENKTLNQEIFTGNGPRMRKQPWKLLLVCRMQEKEHWFA
jgi:pyruvate/2-oxoacid:ferredoxin oxidoreductase alpha subunit